MRVCAINSYSFFIIISQVIREFEWRLKLLISRSRSTFGITEFVCTAYRPIAHYVLSIPISLLCTKRVRACVWGWGRGVTLMTDGSEITLHILKRVNNNQTQMHKVSDVFPCCFTKISHITKQLKVYFNKKQYFPFYFQHTLQSSNHAADI